MPRKAIFQQPQVNILFIVTEKTITPMITEILGTQVHHESSNKISPLHFCQTVEGSMNILKEDSDTESISAKLVIALSTSARDNVLTKDITGSSE